MKAKSVSLSGKCKCTQMLAQLKCKVRLWAPYNSASHTNAQRDTLPAQKLSFLAFRYIFTTHRILEIQTEQLKSGQTFMLHTHFWKKKKKPSQRKFEFPVKWGADMHLNNSSLSLPSLSPSFSLPPPPLSLSTGPRVHAGPWTP